MQKQNNPGAWPGATGANQDAAGQPDPTTKSEIAAPPPDNRTGEQRPDGPAPNGATLTPDNAGDAAEITRLAALPRGEYERERKAAAKRLGYRLNKLDEFVLAVRKEPPSTAAVQTEPTVDFEVCRDIATKPTILDYVAEQIELSGLVGEAKAVKLIYLVMTSRVLERPLCASIKGQSSTGKSTLLDYILPLFPESAYYVTTSMSPMALAYGTEPLVHRVLVVAEAAGLPSD